MADLSGVTTNFLATASETFEDNLSASITAGATIVPVNNASEYVNGDIAVLTVDAGTNDEATFVGRKNGNQFEDCVWTEGNVSADHASGAAIVDYDSATHYNLVTKALKGIMEQDGSLKPDPIREALNLSTASTAGWEVFPNVLQVSSGYNLGAKIYNLTVPNADATAIASQGMALRYERGTTPPTNSLDLESSSSQYATKATPANISFTDDYSIEALFTLESYTGAEQIIVGRRNGTTEGWSLSINANGQLVATAQRIAANNRVLISNKIIPTGEPIHVAVTCDHSGNTHTMYINGESVAFTNTTTGTITAIVQGTSDLRVGALSSAASLYFDGKVQEIRVWNTIRTATQIRDNMGQSLTGSETGLVAYYTFGTNLNDLTANANHLTGSGGAAVSAGNVFKTTEYARIISATYSAPNTTIQVYAGDSFIPNMTLNSLFFSTAEAPYGLPQVLQTTSYNQGRRSIKKDAIDFDSGIWWEELGRASLAVAADTLTVSDLKPKKQLRILVRIVNSGLVDSAIRFNGDAGNNYAYNISDNGAASATGTNVAFITGETAATANQYLEYNVTNYADTAKQVLGILMHDGANSAGTAPHKREVAAKWHNVTDQIRNMTLFNSAGGDMGIGTEIIVLGHD